MISVEEEVDFKSVSVTDVLADKTDEGSPVEVMVDKEEKCTLCDLESRYYDMETNMTYIRTIF